MISFPNSKINLGLHVVRKRSDGYHDIETIFYPLPLSDSLEILVNEEAGKKFSLPLRVTGAELEGDTSSNICIKAYRLLRREFPEIPPVKMHLHKQIPAGSGLGGGSSDGAFAIQMMNEMFKLGLGEKELLEYAAELGSDCPFFILNRPCYAEGRGEKLEPLELDLSAYKFVIVNPGIHIGTGRAFLDIKPEQPERSLKEIIRDPISRWRDELCNDFEKSAFPRHREIVEIKDELYRRGAIYVSMTGSGSTIYGIVEKGKEIDLDFPEKYFVRVC
jgi:4-diphosphocytidyl-2-C-methyl-D-erythritol kinase